MPLSREVMGGGFSAGQAKALNGNVNNTVSAAGTTQATATALKTSNAFVTTVAASAGVILENASHRDSQRVYNAGANALTIYPPVGSRIYPASTNTGINLAVNTFVELYKWSDTVWVGNLSA